MFASLYLCNILSAYSQLLSGSGSVYNPSATAKLFDLFLLLRSDIKIGRGASGCPVSIGTPTSTAEEHRVYPLPPAGAGALPLLVSPHQILASAISSSGKPRRPGFWHMFL